MIKLIIFIALCLGTINASTQKITKGFISDLSKIENAIANNRVDYIGNSASETLDVIERCVKEISSDTEKYRDVMNRLIELPFSDSMSVAILKISSKIKGHISIDAISTRLVLNPTPMLMSYINNVELQDYDDCLTKVMLNINAYQKYSKGMLENEMKKFDLSFPYFFEGAHIALVDYFDKIEQMLPIKYTKEEIKTHHANYYIDE